MSESTYRRLTPAVSAIVLVDHQPGVLAMVGSLPADTVTRNAATLARLANELEIPHVITSTRENLEFLGTTLPEIQWAAPKAYADRIARAGGLDAFTDPRFAAAVEATGRRRLIVAGLLTDVCLFNTVASAVEAGYEVLVVADASGTSTTLADTVTYQRLRDELGVQAASTYGVLFELYPDLSSPEGQKAEGVAAGSVGG